MLHSQARDAVIFRLNTRMRNEANCESSTFQKSVARIQRAAGNAIMMHSPRTAGFQVDDNVEFQTSPKSCASMMAASCDACGGFGASPQRSLFAITRLPSPANRPSNCERRPIFDSLRPDLKERLRPEILRFAGTPHVTSLHEVLNEEANSIHRFRRLDRCALANRDGNRRGEAGMRGCDAGRSARALVLAYD
jgi:hypothetical protein